MSRRWNIPQRDEEEVCRAVEDWQAFSNPNPISSEQSTSSNPEVQEEAPPPPPLPTDLVTVLDRQNCILEFLANTMVNQNNVGQGNVQHNLNLYIHQIRISTDFFHQSLEGLTSLLRWMTSSARLR
jgi:hypothetical protein